MVTYTVRTHQVSVERRVFPTEPALICGIVTFFMSMDIKLDAETYSQHFHRRF